MKKQVENHFTTRDTSASNYDDDPGVYWTEWRLSRIEK